MLMLLLLLPLLPSSLFLLSVSCVSLFARDVLPLSLSPNLPRTRVSLAPVLTLGAGLVSPSPPPALSRSPSDALLLSFAVAGGWNAVSLTQFQPPIRLISSSSNSLSLHPPQSLACSPSLCVLTFIQCRCSPLAFPRLLRRVCPLPRERRGERVVATLLTLHNHAAAEGPSRELLPPSQAEEADKRAAKVRRRAKKRERAGSEKQDDDGSRSQRPRDRQTRRQEDSLME